jgi:hypothetical protein
LCVARTFAAYGEKSASRSAAPVTTSAAATACLQNLPSIPTGQVQSKAG